MARSIDRSLRRLKTDRVDIVQLHSCGVDVLEKGEVIRALEDAREAGKTRFISYSGDNEAAAWAVGSGIFRHVADDPQPCGPERAARPSWRLPIMPVWA